MFKDGSAGGTPITAAELNRLGSQIGELGRVEQISVDVDQNGLTGSADIVRSGNCVHIQMQLKSQTGITGLTGTTGEIQFAGLIPEGLRPKNVTYAQLFYARNSTTPPFAAVMETNATPDGTVHVYDFPVSEAASVRTLRIHGSYIIH